MSMPDAVRDPVLDTPLWGCPRCSYYFWHVTADLHECSYYVDCGDACVADESLLEGADMYLQLMLPITVVVSSMDAGGAHVDADYLLGGVAVLEGADTNANRLHFECGNCSWLFQAPVDLRNTGHVFRGAIPLPATKVKA